MITGKPVISVDERFHRVTVQESLTLTCNVFGNVDHFHWIHEKPNGEVTNLTFINKTVYGNSISYKLYFDAVGLADEGIYRCEAENNAGVSYGNGDIYVSVKEREPMLISEFLSVVSDSTISIREIHNLCKCFNFSCYMRKYSRHIMYICLSSIKKLRGLQFRIYNIYTFK